MHKYDESEPLEWEDEDLREIKELERSTVKRAELTVFGSGRWRPIGDSEHAFRVLCLTLGVSLFTPNCSLWVFIPRICRQKKKIATYFLDLSFIGS